MRRWELSLNPSLLVQDLCIPWLYSQGPHNKRTLLSNVRSLNLSLEPVYTMDYEGWPFPMVQLTWYDFFKKVKLQSLWAPRKV